MARIQKHVRKTSSENNALKNITKYKQHIMQKLIDDDDLCKLLTYQTEDCLDLDSVKESDRYKLINTNIFGYRYVSETAKEAQSYVSMSISGFVPQEGYRQFSDDYLMGYIYFYILVDTAVMSTNYGYRQDLIASRLQNIFQSSRDLGIGEIRLEHFVENWEHNNRFGGYVLGFKTVDFK